jgi:hypothetical protein
MFKRLLCVAVVVLACGIVYVVNKAVTVLNHVPTVDEISAEIGISIPATAANLHYNKQIAFTKIVCVRFQLPADAFKVMLDENSLTTDGVLASTAEVVDSIKPYCDADWWKPERFAGGFCYKRERVPISPKRWKSIYLVSDDVRSSWADVDSAKITVHIVYLNEPGPNSADQL